MQLDSLAVYLNSEIRIINPSGRLVLDTNSPLDVENVVVIENFDSTVTSGSYYIVGDFFGNFDSDVLTVFAPITSNYKVKGYVVIHTDMNDIQKSCNSLLNISYITLAILFLLSLIILIFSPRSYIFLCGRSPMPQSSMPPVICIMNFRWKVRMKSAISLPV